MVNAPPLLVDYRLGPGVRWFGFGRSGQLRQHHGLALPIAGLATTLLGLGGDSNFRRPLAAVVIRGLAASTALSRLIATPSAAQCATRAHRKSTAELLPPELTVLVSGPRVLGANAELGVGNDLCPR